MVLVLMLVVVVGGVPRPLPAAVEGLMIGAAAINVVLPLGIALLLVVLLFLVVRRRQWRRWLGALGRGQVRERDGCEEGKRGSTVQNDDTRLQLPTFRSSTHRPRRLGDGGGLRLRPRRPRGPARQQALLAGPGLGSAF